MLRRKCGYVTALLSAFAVASAFQTQSPTYFSNAFSQDGTKVITSDLGRAAIWDVATGKKISEPFGKSFEFKNAVISPNGLHSLSHSGTDVIITHHQTERKSTIKFGEEDVQITAAFSQDGTRVLTSSFRQSIMVFDIKTLTPRLRLFNNHGRRIYVCAQFSADGTKILSGDYQGGVRVWDARTGNELAAYTLKCGAIWHVSYSPDESKILIGGSEDVALILDAHSGKQLQRFRWAHHSIRSASFSPDGTRVVTGGGEPMGGDCLGRSTNRSLRVWDVKTGRVVMDLKGQREEIRNVSYSPDGTKIFGDGPGFAGIWDAKTGQLLMTLK